MSAGFEYQPGGWRIEGRLISQAAARVLRSAGGPPTVQDFDDLIAFYTFQMIRPVDFDHAPHDWRGYANRVAEMKRTFLGLPQAGEPT